MDGELTVDQEALILREQIANGEPLGAESASPTESKEHGSEESGTESAPENKETQEPTAESGSTEEPSQEVADAGDTGREATEEQKAEDPKLSKYQRAKQREAKAWKKITEEKASLKNQQEQLQAQLQEFEAQKAQLDQERSKVTEQLAKGPDTQTPDALRMVAEQYREEGNEEMAQLAEAKAKEAETTQSKAKLEVQQREFKEAYSKDVDSVVKENPDLRDPNSELYKAVVQIVNSRPQFKGYVGGMSDAVQAAKWQLGAGLSDRLAQENQKLKTDLENLRKKTSLGSGSGNRKQAQPQALEKMSIEEEAAFLRARAVEASK